LRYFISLDDLSTFAQAVKEAKKNRDSQYADYDNDKIPDNNTVSFSQANTYGLTN
jgi:hypothetical protein